MKTYYIYDSGQNRLSSIDKLNTCEVTAKLRLYHGRIFSEDDIRSLWTHKTISPSVDKIRKNLRVKNLKWYINTYTSELITDPEWNPDFLMGMLQWGSIYYNPIYFPSVRWKGNNNLLEAIRSSPYAGRLNTCDPKPGQRVIWSDVPAMCFKHSDKTVEYMAGVLSVGIVETIYNKVLVKYSHKAAKVIEKLKIPVEHRNQRYIYISPFWPVILQKYMPQAIRSKWLLIPKAYLAQEYSTILWKIYTGKDPLSEKMPYMLSRRMVFYKYGSIRALRDLWIKYHLVELDSRFKKVIRDWQ